MDSCLLNEGVLGKEVDDDVVTVGTAGDTSGTDGSTVVVLVKGVAGVMIDD